MYSSSLSTRLMSRVVCVASFESTSLGQPPSVCTMPIVRYVFCFVFT